MPEPVEQVTKKTGFPFAQSLDPLLHISLTISETTCQLANRGVEKLLRWQLKLKRSSAESSVLLSFQIQ